MTEPVVSPIRARVDDEHAFSAPVAMGTGGALARAAASQTLSRGEMGIWECSPGNFRRQMIQAEYSYIIHGEGSFTPDGGKTVEFHAGDSLYFSENTQGEWDIRETVRKAYLIMA